jgi:hypothetical protein
MSQQAISKEDASLQERKCSSYGMRWGKAGLLLQERKYCDGEKNMCRDSDSLHVNNTEHKNVAL